MRVLLVSMPYGSLDRPALGISLLKPALVRRGIDCSIRYLSLDFAELVGVDEYRFVANELPYTAFAGDWSFSGALYGTSAAPGREYVEEILRGTWHLGDAEISRLLSVRSQVDVFLHHCMTAVDWSDYEIVGFTSTFEQNLASLALARRLKDRFPQLSLVFGGANWEGEMGLELHRRFPFVDFVCSGESDHSFPSLVDRLSRGRSPRHTRKPIPGIVYRHRGRSVYTGPARRVDDMDALPVPDFTDYFDAVARSGAGAEIVPTLLVETSRGCWWGARSHCTFCGLNGGGMSYRSKSARRALGEVEELVSRWGIPQVEFTDNILDMSYFEDFVPALAKSGHDVHFFYEVKANLKREQLELLAAAGVTRIQPGIESMSDHILKLMRKGTTTLRNIQTLKWCKEYGITADWNILYGFPGETREDYAAMLELLPSLSVLQPPSACGPVRLDRFSPYFENPASYGIVGVRPMRSYRYLYPFPPEALSRIAYYFEFDYDRLADPRGCADEVIRYVDAWQRQANGGSLTSVERRDGALVLVDTRAGSPRRTYTLSGPDRAAYEFCDEMRTASRVQRFLAREFPGTSFGESNVLASLNSLTANRLMVTDGTYYLSLAIPAARLERVEGREPPASTGC